MRIRPINKANGHQNKIEYSRYGQLFTIVNLSPVAMFLVSNVCLFYECGIPSFPPLSPLLCLVRTSFSGCHVTGLCTIFCVITS